MIGLVPYLKRYSIAFPAAIALHFAVLAGLHATLLSLDESSSKFSVEPKPLKARLIRVKPVLVASPTKAAVPIASTPSSAPKESSERNEDSEGERDQLARLKREREARLEELRNRAFRDALGEEMTAEMIEAMQDLSQVYVTGIYLAVVENWSRPPNARNDMSAVVLVELFPSGDLNSVGVTESSGYLAFDRSTLNAVRRAAPFVVPDDAALFEANFRSFRLNFRPEDLLR